MLNSAHCCCFFGWRSRLITSASAFDCNCLRHCGFKLMLIGHWYREEVVLIWRGNIVYNNIVVYWPCKTAPWHINLTSIHSLRVFFSLNCICYLLITPIFHVWTHDEQDLNQCARIRNIPLFIPLSLPCLNLVPILPTVQYNCPHLPQAEMRSTVFCTGLVNPHKYTHIYLYHFLNL